MRVRPIWVPHTGFTAFASRVEPKPVDDERSIVIVPPEEIGDKRFLIDVDTARESVAFGGVIDEFRSIRAGAIRRPTARCKSVSRLA